MKPCLPALLLLAACAGPRAGSSDRLPPLQVSPSGRYLVQADGTPFLWLGDTAWGLFEKAAPEPMPDQPAVDLYFRTRAAQGFTVVQAALIFEGGRNVLGHPPFEEDRATPRVRPGPWDDFWDTADHVVDRAEAHAVRIAVLPAWAVDLPSDHPLARDPAVAYRYGRFLGERWGRRPHLIWVMGGDPYKKGTDVDNPARLAAARATAEGIADGTNGTGTHDGQADWSTTLMSYHPKGGNHSSSERLHDEPWLDFNMIQTTTCRDFANWKTVERDYRKSPPKPSFDSEVAYEASHSLGGATKEPPLPRISPWEVRRAAYWNVLAGGFGHTYGHRSFIRWTRAGEKLKFGAETPWPEALEAPGARQMAHLRALLLSRPFLSRIPAQDLLEGDPGAGREHVRASRADDGSTAFVYSPSGAPFAVRLDRLSGDTLQLWWFDPRDGTAQDAGRRPRLGVQEFRPPTRGEGQDWVLVLDDAAGGFAAPGRSK
ncbi:MAG TPA: glycoside hydrolase family 140 protein [Planctomycetota bacterium]|nr:glycoside hydrolase family 140 protein [Planctomycetota bacterium]